MLIALGAKVVHEVFQWPCTVLSRTMTVVVLCYTDELKMHIVHHKLADGAPHASHSNQTETETTEFC